MKRLIVTADDFGRCLPINEAVEDAHRHGILTAASLMVAGDAVEDAVARALRLPQLAVGLHITLVDGAPVSPPETIPDLLDGTGRFSNRLTALGVRIGFEAKVRQQVEREMRAQFLRYQALGLPFDHVDSHHHYHLHPTVSAIMIRLAREFGVRAMRIPVEPGWHSARARHRPILPRLWGQLAQTPLIVIMRWLARSSGLQRNDRVFGVYDSGKMDAEAVRQFIEALPDGVNELYCHPATRDWDDHPMPAAYRCIDEYRALIDPAVIAAVQRSEVELTRFGEIVSG